MSVMRIRTLGLVATVNCGDRIAIASARAPWLHALLRRSSRSESHSPPGAGSLGSGGYRPAELAKAVMFGSMACALLAIGMVAPASAAALPGELLAIDYESGDIESGRPADVNTPDENVPGSMPPDNAQVVTDGVIYGNYALATKTVLGDAGYYGTGQLRAESSTRTAAPTQATVPTFRSYQFSISLKDWEYWVANPTPLRPDGPGIYRNDLRSVLWQFKRNNASPVEAYFAVRGNRLDFTYGNVGSGQHVVVPDLRPLDGQWIDIRVDVRWAEDTSGSYVVGVRLPDQADYTTIVNLPDIKTWKSSAGGGDQGVAQWGDFRPNSSNAQMVRLGNAPITRVMRHDAIRISDRQLPPPVRTSFDTDQDGVADAVENAAPHNGDANNDGLPDAQQGAVVSRPNPVTGGYVTAELADRDCAFTKFKPVPELQVPAQDLLLSYQRGLFDSRHVCPTPGQTTTMKIYFNQVYNTTGWMWNQFNRVTGLYLPTLLTAYDTASNGVSIVTTASFPVGDGGLLDDDLRADGVFTHISGPGTLL